ncbi:MAG: cysteine desulfurase NifS [Candidatus Tritonobacter lacicola]|nr:cysteine desulfurase NifS [Candidatus Tritonobacter lacicola]
MRTVYMDSNATTRVADEVLEDMLPYFCEYYGNPSSMHTFGGQVASKLDEARGRVAALLGALPEEIIFTSCGTESDNSAIMGTLGSYPHKRHIVTTRVEHPAVLSLCKHLAGEGYSVTQLSVDRDGNLDLAELRESLTEDTAIVSIMHANNETGVIFPIEEIGRIVKSRGIVFHTDAVQTAGKIPIDMSGSTVDLLSISGHKFHAPKGVGALYIRKGTKFHSFLIGGHQERGRRGGTESVPMIIGMGKAAELAAEFLEDENVRVRGLRDKLESELLEKAPSAELNGDRERRTPNTTNISFQYVEGEAILLLIDREGICASSGSACTAGSLEPSHVLRAMGLPFTAAHGTVRFSLSRYNTEDEVDYVIEKVPPIIRRLREISPFGREELSKGS